MFFSERFYSVSTTQTYNLVQDRTNRIVGPIWNVKGGKKRNNYISITMISVAENGFRNSFFPNYNRDGGEKSVWN